METQDRFFKTLNWIYTDKDYNIWDEKKSLDGIHGWSDIAEEEISENEDISIKSTYF